MNRLDNKLAPPGREGGGTLNIPKAIPKILVTCSKTFLGNTLGRKVGHRVGLACLGQT